MTEYDSKDRIISIQDQGIQGIENFYNRKFYYNKENFLSQTIEIRDEGVQIRVICKQYDYTDFDNQHNWLQRKVGISDTSYNITYSEYEESPKERKDTETDRLNDISAILNSDKVKIPFNLSKEKHTEITQSRKIEYYQRLLK